jgi:hypothetical protein
MVDTAQVGAHPMTSGRWGTLYRKTVFALGAQCLSRFDELAEWSLPSIGARGWHGHHKSANVGLFCDGGM